MRASMLAAMFTLALAGQSAQKAAPRLSRDITFEAASNAWTTTDIELESGERAVFTATGTGRCGQETEFGPAGAPRGFRDLLRVLPVQSGRGTLLGRIGDADVALPFVIGASGETVSTSGGPLAFGINRSDNDACTATFAIHVDVFPPVASGTAGVATEVDAIAGVDAALLAQVPRRIKDKQGNAGDMVNFLILGSQAAMTRVFKAAGWVTVDADVGSAIVSGVLNSLSKEAYLTLPMSLLYLFDRPQDFGWAHAEPIKVASARHHLRVWKAPFTAGDSMVWVGAATHDIGFERDQRNNGVTHKIDSDVDLERDYVEKTLTRTGLVSDFTYVAPKDGLKQANTATGGSFYSDGMILVLKLTEPQ